MGKRLLTPWCYHNGSDVPLFMCKDFQLTLTRGDRASRHPYRSSVRV
jgi:hypothetical protein